MGNSNITKNRTRIALLLVLAASIISLAPVCSTSAMAASASYSISDVSGNYVDLGSGYLLDSSKKSPYFPYSFVGLVTFTPATGTWHVDWVVREYGFSTPLPHDGTYTVDATGHGTMTWLSVGGNTKTRDFYIVKGGAELKYIDSDPEGTVLVSDSGTMTKQ